MILIKNFIIYKKILIFAKQNRQNVKCEISKTSWETATTSLSRVFLIIFHVMWRSGTFPMLLTTKILINVIQWNVKKINRLTKSAISIITSTFKRIFTINVCNGWLINFATLWKWNEIVIKKENINFYFHLYNIYRLKGNIFLGLCSAIGF